MVSSRLVAIGQNSILRLHGRRPGRAKVGNKPGPEWGGRGDWVCTNLFGVRTRWCTPKSWTDLWAPSCPLLWRPTGTRRTTRYRRSAAAAGRRNRKTRAACTPWGRRPGPGCCSSTDVSGTSRPGWWCLENARWPGLWSNADDDCRRPRTTGLTTQRGRGGPCSTDVPRNVPYAAGLGKIRKKTV